MIKGSWETMAPLLLLGIFIVVSRFSPIFAGSMAEIWQKSRTGVAPESRHASGQSEGPLVDFLVVYCKKVWTFLQFNAKWPYAKVS